MVGPNRSDWTQLGETLAASAVLAIGTAIVWTWQTIAGGIVAGFEALEAWTNGVVSEAFGGVASSFGTAAETASASTSTAGPAAFLVAVAATVLSLLVLSRVFGVVVRGS